MKSYFARSIEQMTPAQLGKLAALLFADKQALRAIQAQLRARMGV